MLTETNPPRHMPRWEFRSSDRDISLTKWVDIIRSCGGTDITARKSGPVCRVWFNHADASRVRERIEQYLGRNFSLRRRRRWNENIP